MEKNKLYYMKQANFLIKKLAAICLFFHLLFLTLYIIIIPVQVRYSGTLLSENEDDNNNNKNKTHPTPTYNQPSFFNFQSTEFKIII